METGNVTLPWIPNISAQHMAEIVEAINTFVKRFQNTPRGAVKYYEFEQKALVESGNNFLSVLLVLKVHFKSTHQSQSIIVKVPQLAANYEPMLAFSFFKKETYMYEHVLPRMGQLYGTPFAPICYSSDKFDILFLENLLESNYRPREGKRMLDKKHCEVALTVLAHYHAVSVKFLEEKGWKDLEEISKNDYKVNFALKGQIESVIAIFIEEIDRFMPRRITEKIRQYFQDASNLLQVKVRSPYEGGVNVICHGDLWLNNFLFEYDQNGLPQNMKMVDFQLSSRCSPLVDLLYFFITSVQFEVFQQHRCHFTRLYLSEFANQMEKLKCDVAFSETEFDEHFNKYLKLLTLFAIGIAVPVSRSGRSTFYIRNEEDKKYYKSQEFKCISTNWLNFVDQNCDLFH